jgi:hypothetical protein
MLAKLTAKLKQLVTRNRVIHYTDVFLSAFGMSLLVNKEHILGAHGLNAWKSLILAALVAGGKATIEAYRNAKGKTAPAAASK